MNDEFQKKLAAYEKGELTGDELQQFEQELEKLESYQQHLTQGERLPPFVSPPVSQKKQQKILKRGKWKARFQTALTALVLFLAVLIVTSILTTIYYAWGNPDRGEVLRNVIDHTLTVTQPDGYLGGTSTNAKTFFRMEATRDIRKRVGHETITVGDMKVNFLFSMMSFPEINYYGRQSQSHPHFIHPNSAEMYTDSNWEQLEQLPEGTVASAYVSFDQLYETGEVFQLMEGKNLDLLWLAVAIEQDEHGEFHDSVIFEPLGFPSFPIWHEDDMIVTSRTEEKGFGFGKIISEGAISPDYEMGDETILHQQFLKTLQFLAPHESKVNNLSHRRINLPETIDYLQSAGIQHYGIVITGPTKELLTLKDEPWITSLQVDEVAFWNWNK